MLRARDCSTPEAGCKALQRESDKMGKHLVLTSRQLLFQKEFRLRAASVTPAWTREIVSTQLDHLYLSCILQKIFEQNGLNFGAGPIRHFEGETLASSAPHQRDRIV